MKQTKITVKVYEPLLESFNEKLETCFIKRDAFLNYMIKSETPHLASDMKGLKLTNSARRYISGELKRLGTKTINVVVDKDTAENLKFIVDKCYMSRDSFINRLILFLNSSEKLIEALNLPTQINDGALSSAEAMTTSPLLGISSIVHDPLFYLRIAIEEEHKEKLYTFGLPKEFVGMSCYLDDVDVPGTVEYRKQQNELSKLTEIMSMPFNAKVGS